MPLPADPHFVVTADLPSLMVPTAVCLATVVSTIEVTDVGGPKISAGQAFYHKTMYI